MIQRKYFSFFVGGILLLSTPFSISSGIYNLFEKLIFGSSLMPLEDQELCNEVKDFLDVGEDHQLYYSRWPWNYFSSFTQMTGTWIDKETWDNLDLEEKIFIVHHEISHKALKHPLKHYVLALGNFIVIAYCFDKLIKWGRKPSDPVIENLIIQKWGKQVISNRNLFIKITDALITTFVSLAATLIVSFSYTRQCEQQADEKAIESLCLQERSDVIEYEINYLKKILKDHGNIKNLWFPSVKDQIKYFENALGHYS